MCWAERRALSAATPGKLLAVENRAKNRDRHRCVAPDIGTEVIDAACDPVPLKSVPAGIEFVLATEDDHARPIYLGRKSSEVDDA